MSSSQDRFQNGVLQSTHDAGAFSGGSTSPGLRLSDLANAAATCAGCDPGPDPTYDPDPIPDDPNSPAEGE